MDRERVKKVIRACTVEELEAWREHAVKCLNYFLTYWNEFEVDECKFVIDHIDGRLRELKGGQGKGFGEPGKDGMVK